MQNRLRDAILIVTVVVALFVTGSALYGLGRRLPPPPDVRPTPAHQIAPDSEDPR
jgi:hypothetical protein